MEVGKVIRHAVGAAGVSVAAALLVPPAAVASTAHDGWMLAERIFDWDRDQPSYGTPPRRGDNSWQGGRQQYDHVAPWAVGTFRGQNGANGSDETITIHPDGSAELRVRGEAPRHGSFAGETLTFDRRINRVQPTRGGIVIDGAYYYR